ncbi:Golgi-associated plant pathogenesis-related protein 1, partial [Stegodyphus mimosarum]
MSDNSRPMAKGTEVVDSWYSEHVFYPYSGQITREIVMKAGHFTQVIWRNSKEMGIGKAVSRRNRVYVVANYYPAGNVLNKFADNVPRKVHTSYESRRYSRRIFTRTVDFQHQVSYHN